MLNSYCRRTNNFKQDWNISVDISVDRKAIICVFKRKKKMEFVEEQKLFLLPT